MGTAARRPVPEVVTGPGPDEVAALHDPDDHIRGILELDRTRPEELNRRLRQAYLTGSEEHSREHEERGLTAEERERVLRHYPGDLGA